MVFGCQGTCLSPLASASPLLLGTSGCCGLAPCARLPTARGSIRLAHVRLARAHVLPLRESHAQNRVSSLFSWGSPLRRVTQTDSCSASLTSSHRSSETSVCPLFFGGVEGDGGCDVQTGVFPSCTHHWVWADDFSPCSLLNAALLHKEARFFFSFCCPNPNFADWAICQFPPTLFCSY